MKTRYHMTDRSTNAKTGAIPVTTSAAATCPLACPFRDGGGCYADGGPLAIHWRRVSDGSRGITFGALLDKIRALAPGQIWRWAQAGDLPGAGDAIAEKQSLALADANDGRPVIAYTHKPVVGRHGEKNLAIVRAMARRGFPVNLSSNDRLHADAIASVVEDVPIVCVLPSDAADRPRDYATTPAGRKLVVCPAATGRTASCATCGAGRPLCSRGADRGFIIGFPAHGSKTRTINERV